MPTVPELLESLRTENLPKSNTLEIAESFLGKIKGTDFESTFLQSSDEQERIALVKKYFEYVPLGEDVKKGYVKSSKKSAEFRNPGNEVYKEKNFEDALTAYNLAALFAPPPEEGSDLGLAYANRSAVLHELTLTEEAIKDVNLALENNYPEEKKSKLEERIAKYEKSIENRKENMEGNWNLENVTRNYDWLFNASEERNPKLPAAVAGVDIAVDEQKGRKLVANRDIPIGTTVILENPMVASLQNGHKWDLNHCHYCLKQNYRCIPCKGCVFALYCDETCREAAEQGFHKYECPCMPELLLALTDTADTFFGPIFRLICTLGPAKLIKIYSDEKAELATSNKIPGTDPETGIYDPESYLSLHHLQSSYDLTLGHRPALMSLVLSRLLKENTDFFEGVPKKALEGFQDFIAKIILHNYETSRVNMFGMGEISPMKRLELRKPGEAVRVYYDYELTALTMGSTVSLLNHSCDPNVMRFFGRTHATMALVTTRPLRQGEELTITYWPSYGEAGRDGGTKARREHLSKLYHFECNCVACRNDWPDIMKKKDFTETLCCRLCCRKFSYEEKVKPEYDACVIPSDWVCTLCGKKKAEKKINEQLERYGKFLDLADKDLFKSNMVMPELKDLVEMLAYLEAITRPPSKSYHRALYTIREIVHRSINF